MSSKELPKHARVAVIGGGVVGCSVLYHLAKKGWQDILLLERRELSCGSSWHAAGAFHIINSNANLSALQLHTLKFYPQLEEEAQQSIGLHRPGGIYFASTKERLNYLVQERAKNRAGNPDMEFIDLAEAKRMHPLIDEKRFLGALYDPLDGYIDPASVVQAYAKAAKKHGAKVFQHTMVNAISPQNGDWEVQTDKGVISAEYVVNAGGLWAREVGQMVGWQPPLMAMEHHYLITDNLPEVENLGHTNYRIWWTLTAMLTVGKRGAACCLALMKKTASRGRRIKRLGILATNCCRITCSALAPVWKSPFNIFRRWPKPVLKKWSTGLSLLRRTATR